MADKSPAGRPCRVGKPERSQDRERGRENLATASAALLSRLLEPLFLIEGRFGKIRADARQFEGLAARRPVAKFRRAVRVSSSSSLPSLTMHESGYSWHRDGKGRVLGTMAIGALIVYQKTSRAGSGPCFHGRTEPHRISGQALRRRGGARRRRVERVPQALQDV